MWCKPMAGGLCHACSVDIILEMIEVPVTVMLYGLVKVLSITLMLKCDLVSSQIY